MKQHIFRALFTVAKQSQFYETVSTFPGFIYAINT